MNKFRVFLAIGVGMLLAPAVQSANFGSRGSLLAYDVPGNPRCQNLAAGSRELRVTRPLAGAIETISDPGGPAIRYTIGSDGRSLSWKIDGDNIPAGQRVTMLTLASGNGSRVHYFPMDGATRGDGVLAPGRIKELAFCYGLAEARVSGGRPLPRCETGCRVDPSTHEEPTQLLLRVDAAPGSGAEEACACGGPGDEVREEECTLDKDLNCDDGWYCYKSGGKRICVWR